jgi:1,4-alpha-glucan branching enzyme
LVGDFNEWGTEDSEMERVGRVWRKVVNLHPGRYQYRFVVDGQWLSDPSNSAQEPCPGGYNSVLHLDEKSAETYLN